jgi:hypothetical protein
MKNNLIDIIINYLPCNEVTLLLSTALILALLNASFLSFENDIRIEKTKTQHRASDQSFK